LSGLRRSRVHACHCTRFLDGRCISFLECCN
jgi:hypothetical protein